MVFLSERDDSPVAPALSVSAAEGARRLLSARPAFVCASPLECADLKNAPVSSVQCAHTKTKDLKPPGMSSYKKTGGGGPLSLPVAASIAAGAAALTLPAANAILDAAELGAALHRLL